MTSISYDWHNNLIFVGQTLFFILFSISHGNLEASGQILELSSLSNISILQTRSHGVNVEEGVFSVFDVSNGLAID